MKEYEIRPRSLLERYIAASIADIPRFFDQSRFVRIECPGCASERAAPAFDKNGFTYERCSECGSLYANPRPPLVDLARYYEEGGAARFWAEEFYPRTADARREKIYRPRAGQILEVCRAFGAAPRVLVDVGSGFGILPQEVASLAPELDVRGLEPNPSLAKVCRERGVEVLERPVEDASDWHEQADVVTSFEVIEHVFQPLDFVSAAKELLRPGGLLILGGLGIDGFDTQVLWERSKAIQPPHHLNFMSVVGFEALFRRAGFADVSVTTPGRLDVDIVRNALGERPDTPLPRFVKLMLEHRGSEVHERFQEFLAWARMSSYAWVVGRALPSEHGD